MLWGLIGGGRGSQIGGAHRIAAQLDGRFRLAAGALDADPAAARSFARELGLPEDRAYGDWREMLAAERERADRLDLVTVATPNATHFEIAAAFLEAGFHVLCEKPLTMEVAEADRLAEIAKRSGKLCCVNFGYSGYPLIHQARAMARAGELGEIRVVVAEFAHGHHADAADADNPRVRWRYDPAQAGVSSVTADCGIHALHLAQFVVGQRLEALAAHFDRCVEGRQLEDDALIAFRMDGGARGRLWTSAVATGQIHGLTLRVFGSKGGLAWRQEQPNQLEYSPLNQPKRILERGDGSLHPKARAGSRTAVGHVEGMLIAFANLYAAFGAAIAGDEDAALGAEDLPSLEDGIDMVRAVDAAARSAEAGGAWTPLR